jgi:hypothetical protein
MKKGYACRNELEVIRRRDEARMDWMMEVGGAGSLECETPEIH